MQHRIGIDENGLGARLGPLLVTAVLARVDERGQRLLSRKPPAWLSGYLGDSKALIFHGSVALGEAWARAVVGGERPEQLVERIALDDRATLRAPCPQRVEAQCWSGAGEAFETSDADLAGVRGVLARLQKRGCEVLEARAAIVCTERMNQALAEGRNRFVVDLHAMERLILALRQSAGADVDAVCGKVGGMTAYERFLGPLGDRLRSVEQESRALSRYRFPGIGAVEFRRDADGEDALVMLASLIGKYLRELLMARIVRFHAPGQSASGYHDPVSARFVEASALSRRKHSVPDTCFERARAERPATSSRPAAARRGRGR